MAARAPIYCSRLCKQRLKSSNEQRVLTVRGKETYNKSWLGSPPLKNCRHTCWALWAARVRAQSVQSHVWSSPALTRRVTECVERKSAHFKVWRKARQPPSLFSIKPSSAASLYMFSTHFKFKILWRTVGCRLSGACDTFNLRLTHGQK